MITTAWWTRRYDMQLYCLSYNLQQMLHNQNHMQNIKLQLMNWNYTKVLADQQVSGMHTFIFWNCKGSLNILYKEWLSQKKHNRL